MKYIILAGAMLSLAACATGGSSWTQQSWLGQKAKDFNSGPWKFSAAPVRGNGFKMQFKINLNLLYQRKLKHSKWKSRYENLLQKSWLVKESHFSRQWL